MAGVPSEFHLKLFDCRREKGADGGCLRGNSWRG